MNIRFQNSPAETSLMNTEELRENFLIPELFKADMALLTYTHCDRVIIGGILPVKKAITLRAPEELKAEYFLERREMGIINVGGDGIVSADGENFKCSKLDCVYLGKETKKITFKSVNGKKPARFYILSAPAHHKYPNIAMTKEEALPANLGDISTSNKRVLYKYIHKDGIKSCQLVMGVTVLEPGNVWNSVPPHTHTRRMEVYFYFDVPAQHRVMHFMGEPQETRHLVMADQQAVISPPWSMHFGCGTSNYGFIWGMAGENQEFTDMDPAPIADIL